METAMDDATGWSRPIDKAASSVKNAASVLRSSIPQAAVAQPIPIAYVITSLEVAGSERQHFLLLERLDRERFAPHVIAFFSGGMEQRFRSLGVPVDIIRCRQVRLSALLRCWRKLQEIRPAIVHTIGQSANVWGRSAAALAHVPIIIASERNSAEVKGRLRLAIDRQLTRLTTSVITNSYHSGAFFLRRGIVGAAKLETIQNGIDVCAFRAAAGSGGAARLGTVGEMRKSKYHGDLLRAFQRVVSSKPQAKLEIAGDGALRGELEAEIRRLGLDGKVLLHGWVHQINDFLEHLDVYVHPAHHEGLPNAVMEAMACGLPCVAFDTPGCAELIRDGQTGLLVPTGDCEALGEAALRLLADRELAARLGSAAREFIRQHFSVERMVSEHVALYELAIKRAAICPKRLAAL
jgi:glycosyltransferase involved in cell wall biosynthesis